jgi:dGTPase
MSQHGGFEGNGQTLRILTELIYERPGRTKGIAPTRAFLDGVMKYKATQGDWFAQTSKAPHNHFIYDDQALWRNQVFGQDYTPDELSTPKALNKFKSIECQIMDWADDTAYSLHDIVDGIHARYISVGSLTEWAAQQSLDCEQHALIDTLCKKIKSNSYEPYFGSKVGTFVHACTLKKRAGFLSEKTNRHAFDLEIDQATKDESALYKKIALDLIFRSTQLQQIEFKGGYILERMFSALAEHCTNPKSKGLNLLPVSVQELIEQEPNEAGRYRRLCDYTAGLTDALAVRTYKRLFNADFGSIAELL